MFYKEIILSESDSETIAWLDQLGALWNPLPDGNQSWGFTVPELNTRFRVYTTPGARERLRQYCVLMDAAKGADIPGVVFQSLNNGN